MMWFIGGRTEVLPKPVSCQSSGFFPWLLASESWLGHKGHSLLLLCTGARDKAPQGLLLAMTGKLSCPTMAHGTTTHPKVANARASGPDEDDQGGILIAVFLLQSFCCLWHYLLAGAQHPQLAQDQAELWVQGVALAAKSNKGQVASLASPGAELWCIPFP